MNRRIFFKSLFAAIATFQAANVPALTKKLLEKEKIPNALNYPTGRFSESFDLTMLNDVIDIEQADGLPGATIYFSPVILLSHSYATATVTYEDGQWFDHDLTTDEVIKHSSMPENLQAAIKSLGDMHWLCRPIQSTHFATAKGSLFRMLRSYQGVPKMIVEDATGIIGGV